MLKFTNLTRLFLFLKSSPKCTQYSCFGSRKCQTSPDSFNGQVQVEYEGRGVFPYYWFHCIVDLSHFNKDILKTADKTTKQPSHRENTQKGAKINHKHTKQTRRGAKNYKRPKTTTKMFRSNMRSVSATVAPDQLIFSLTGATKVALSRPHLQATLKPTSDPALVYEAMLLPWKHGGFPGWSLIAWSLQVGTSVISEATANKCKLINRTWEKTNDFMLSDKSWDILEGRGDMRLNVEVVYKKFIFLPVAGRSFSVSSHPMLQHTHLKSFHHLLKIMWRSEISTDIMT